MRPLGNTENGEEEKLLSILKTNSSYLQMPALRKLIRIYKKKPEDTFIYNFLENHNYNDHESTNFVLECLFDFFDQRISHQSRAEKIYNNEKIMENLTSLIKSSYAQTNALIVLVQILQGRPCKVQWIEDIVEVFCATKRNIIENLTGKIIVRLMKSNYSFSYDMLNLIQRKLDRQASSSNAETSHVINQIRLLLGTTTIVTVNEYLDLLSKDSTYGLLKFINRDFIQSHIGEIEEKADVITRLYTDMLQLPQCNKAAAMKHVLLLLDNSEVLGKKLGESAALEILYEMADCKDGELSYLSTKIITRIL